MVFNAQSTISDYIRANTIHLSTQKSQSLLIVPDISQSMFGEVYIGSGGNEVELTGKADISRLDALAVGQACYARLYSYSRLKQWELLIALGSHRVGEGGGGNFCNRSTPPLREPCSPIIS